MAPILTRIGNAFGFGASSGGGAAPEPPYFTYTRLLVNGNPSPDTNVKVPNADITSGHKFDIPGYYTLEWKGDPGNVTCWTWGAGGGRQGTGPGPGNGGGGNGVRGTTDFTVGDTWTILVGQGGTGPGSANTGGSPAGNDYLTGTRAFPDSGWATYNGCGGGGSSRMAKTEIPYANMNSAPEVYHLIGGAGGGGIGYTNNSGTMDGRGGYPAGYGGGGYYNDDGGVYGRGATQTGGGPGGPAGRRPAGHAGTKYAGGRSGDEGGGAGGGGYYGGGGAGGYYGTGGGGSGYIHPEMTSTASFLGPEPNRYLASTDPTNPTIFDVNTRSRGDEYCCPHAKHPYPPASPIGPGNTAGAISNGQVSLKY